MHFRYQQVISEFLDFWVCIAQFNGKFTLNQCDAQIYSKAWIRLNVMRKLKFILDRKSLEIIHTSFIRPILEYADVVWDNCIQYAINALEEIQIKANYIKKLVGKR